MWVDIDAAVLCFSDAVYCFLFFNLQLRNPHSESPPFRFGTVPDGSTALNLKKNHPDMYAYMENYNKGIVKDGIKAVKNKYVGSFTCAVCAEILKN